MKDIEKETFEGCCLGERRKHMIMHLMAERKKGRNRERKRKRNN
jgi:hypothetical protein